MVPSKKQSDTTVDECHNDSYSHYSVPNKHNTCMYMQIADIITIYHIVGKSGGEKVW